jgi:hypothetical protein
MGVVQRIKDWWQALTPSEWELVKLLRSLYRLLTSSPALAVAILERLSSFIERMRALEAEFPQAGSGSRRLAAFLGWLEGEHGQALKQVARWSDAVKAVTSVVQVLVIVFNTTGLFSKGTEPGA